MLRIQDNNFMTPTMTTFPIQYHTGYNLDFALIFMLMGSIFMGFLTLFTYQYIKKEKYRRLNNLYTDEEMKLCPKELGARMKYLERYSENNVSVVPPTHSFIIKLDGRGFSRLLREYNVTSVEENNIPYSEEIRTAFEYTTADLMKEFHATTGYTYLDKIFLVFPPTCMNSKSSTHICGGRVNKLNSIISSFATSRFISYLNNQTSNRHINGLLSYSCCKISFVSNVVVFPDFNQLELVNYLGWHNNSLSELRFKYHLNSSYFDNKVNTHTDTLKNILQTQYLINYDNFDLSIRRGVFIKRASDSDSTNYYKFIVYPILETKQDVLEFMYDSPIQEWEYRLVADVDGEHLRVYDLEEYIIPYVTENTNDEETEDEYNHEEEQEHNE
jgi:tRNA(His) 5'-end guanylyltransferase